MIVHFNNKYELEGYKNNDPEFVNFFYKSLAEQLRIYGLSGYALGVPDAGDTGQICLHRDGIFWAVYISERGERSNPVFFSSAIDAANHLIWKLSCAKNKNFPSFVFDMIGWNNDHER